MRENEQKKRTWIRGDVSVAVVFVDAMPANTLAERCREEFPKAGFKVRVVERSGSSIKNKLVKSNPFKKLGCGRAGCAVCALGCDVDCKARKVHYKISCEGSNVSEERCQNVNTKGKRQEVQVNDLADTLVY